MTRELLQTETETEGRTGRLGFPRRPDRRKSWCCVWPAGLAEVDDEREMHGGREGRTHTKKTEDPPLTAFALRRDSGQRDQPFRRSIGEGSAKKSGERLPRSCICERHRLRIGLAHLAVWSGGVAGIEGPVSKVTLD